MVCRGLSAYPAFHISVSLPFLHPPQLSSLSLPCFHSPSESLRTKGPFCFCYGLFLGFKTGVLKWNVAQLTFCLFNDFCSKCWLRINPCLGLVGGCLLRKDEIMNWVDWLTLNCRKVKCDLRFCHVDEISSIFGFYCSLVAVTHIAKLVFVPLPLPFLKDCNLASHPAVCSYVLSSFSYGQSVVCKPHCIHYYCCLLFNLIMS